MVPKDQTKPESIIAEAERSLRSLESVTRASSRQTATLSTMSFLDSLRGGFRPGTAPRQIAMRIAELAETASAQVQPEQLKTAIDSYQASLEQLEAIDLTSLNFAQCMQLAATTARLQDDLTRFAVTAAPPIPDPQATLLNAVEQMEHFAAANPHLVRRAGLLGAGKRHAFTTGVNNLRRNILRRITPENPLGHIPATSAHIEVEVATGCAFGMMSMNAAIREVTYQDALPVQELSGLCELLERRMDIVAMNQMAPFAASLGAQLDTLSTRIAVQLGAHADFSGKVREHPNPSVDLGGLGR